MECGFIIYQSGLEELLRDIEVADEIIDEVTGHIEATNLAAAIKS